MEKLPRPIKEIELHWFAADMVEDKTTDVFWIHGGVGSAKSFGAVQKLYSWILDNAACPMSWWILPTHAKVKDAGIPKWLEWFDLIGLVENKHYELRLSAPCEIRLKHGKLTHTLVFQSADRPRLMVANQIGAFVLSEAGQVTYEVFERATTRRRDKRASYLQSIVEGQPEGMNWFADKANFDGYDEKRNEKSYELWTEDNAHNLAPGYIEACLKAFGHNQAKVESWLYGKFRNFFEGQAYSEYKSDRDRHSSEAEFTSPIVLSWDFNVHPLAWVAMQRKRFEESGKARFKTLSVGESSGRSNLIMEACAEFIHQFPPGRFGRTPIRVTGDATGYARSVRASGSNYDEIKSYLKEYYQSVEVITPKVNPEVTVRIEAVNKAFSYGAALIGESHDNLNRSLINTCWETGTKKLKKPSGDDWTHWADAWGYGLCQLLDIERLDQINLPKIFAT